MQRIRAWLHGLCYEQHASVNSFISRSRQLFVQRMLAVPECSRCSQHGLRTILPPYVVLQRAGTSMHIAICRMALQWQSPAGYVCRVEKYSISRGTEVTKQSSKVTWLSLQSIQHDRPKVCIRTARCTCMGILYYCSMSDSTLKHVSRVLMCSGHILSESVLCLPFHTGAVVRTALQVPWQDSRATQVRRCGLLKLCSRL